MLSGCEMFEISQTEQRAARVVYTCAWSSHFAAHAEPYSGHEPVRLLRVRHERRPALEGSIQRREHRSYALGPRGVGGTLEALDRHGVERRKAAACQAAESAEVRATTKCGAHDPARSTGYTCPCRRK